MPITSASGRCGWIWCFLPAPYRPSYSGAELLERRASRATGRAERQVSTLRGSRCVVSAWTAESVARVLRVFGVAFVVFAALAIHAAGGLEHVLWVEAAQGAGLQDLIHGVLGDHHPLRRVRHRQRLVEEPVKAPDHPPPRTR